jgi:tRNA isopentenyl-2-thiomethyl-A-37 hydroxylase MiaE
MLEIHPDGTTPLILLKGLMIKVSFRHFNQVWSMARRMFIPYMDVHPRPSAKAYNLYSYT